MKVQKKWLSRFDTLLSCFGNFPFNRKLDRKISLRWALPFLSLYFNPPVSGLHSNLTFSFHLYSVRLDVQSRTAEEITKWENCVKELEPSTTNRRFIFLLYIDVTQQLFKSPFNIWWPPSESLFQIASNWLESSRPVPLASRLSSPDSLWKWNEDDSQFGSLGDIDQSYGLSRRSVECQRADRQLSSTRRWKWEDWVWKIHVQIHSRSR